jgi:hypothetical protein
MYTPKSTTGLRKELAKDPLDGSIQAYSSARAVDVPEDLYALIKQRTAILCA